MNIKENGKLYLGDAPVQKAYLGDAQVYDVDAEQPQGDSGSPVEKVKIGTVRYIRFYNYRKIGNRAQYIEVSAIDVNKNELISGKIEGTMVHSDHTPTALSGATDGSNSSGAFIKLSDGDVRVPGLEIDLGAQYEVKHVNYLITKSDGEFFQQVRVDVSSDGVGWFSIYELDDYTNYQVEKPLSIYVDTGVSVSGVYEIKET